MSKRLLFTLICALATTTFFLGRVSGGADDAKKSDRVFEIRTYTAADGKFDALLDRFRNHTTKLFEKHGMTNIGYWIPQDEPLSKNTLVYILAHESRDAAKKNWAEFKNDPAWQKIKSDSEAAGPLVTHVDDLYVNPADFSPLK
jgi:NIPSNAP protein